MMASPIRPRSSMVSTELVMEFRARTFRPARFQRSKARFFRHHRTNFEAKTISSKVTVLFGISFSSILSLKYNFSSNFCRFCFGLRRYGGAVPSRAVPRPIKTKQKRREIQNITWILTPEALLVVALLNYSCKLTWCLSFLTLFFSFSSNIATSIDNMLSLFNKA